MPLIIIIIYREVFGDGPSNAANQIFPRSIPFTMAAKSGGNGLFKNSACIRDISKIFSSNGRFWRLAVG